MYMSQEMPNLRRSLARFMLSDNHKVNPFVKTFF